MDCHMPVMDGFEATSRHSGNRSAHQSNTVQPSLVHARCAMSGDREACIAAGMDDYLSKPIDIDLLKAGRRTGCVRKPFLKAKSKDEKVLRPNSAF